MRSPGSQGHHHVTHPWGPRSRAHKHICERLPGAGDARVLVSEAHTSRAKEGAQPGGWLACGSCSVARPGREVSKQQGPCLVS